MLPTKIPEETQKYIDLLEKSLLLERETINLFQYKVSKFKRLFQKSIPHRAIDPYLPHLLEINNITFMSTNYDDLLQLRDLLKELSDYV